MGAAKPTNTPVLVSKPDVPRLSAQQAKSLVGERLAGGYRIQMERAGTATYNGKGVWRVVFRGGEWDVLEDGHKVLAMNRMASVLEESGKAP